MTTNSKNLFKPSADHDNDDQADRLLGEVAEDYFHRVAQGESPSIDDYATRYPEIADLIRDTFAAVAFINQSSASAVDSDGSDTKNTGAHGPLAVGDFRIIREIGRGGMGVVYEAEQLSLGRSVALKVLPYAAMLDQKAIMRFKNEARAAATLDHPNIVPIHAVGNERGIYYYAMSLVEGVTLAELISELQRNIGDPKHSNERLSLDRWIGCHDDSVAVSHLAPTIDGEHPTRADTPQPCDSTATTYREIEAAVSTNQSRFDQTFFRSIASLGLHAAEALEHAHQHGIVHRDIKPGNLIIDTGAKIWITDFGLARIESEAGMTMTGDLIGTLRYMAPEQALAERVVVDHRADIYALGATLYELLALRPVFDGPHREALLNQIAFMEARPLRSLNGSVPEDLQTIVHKSIEKNPDERYQSAQAMANDLRAFITDEPIKARPLTFGQRARRWATRHSWLVASIAGLMIMAVIGLTISVAMITEQRNLARENATQERLQRQRALANLDKAQDAIESMLLNVANDSLLNVPHMEDVRRQILQDALSVSMGLLADQSDNRSTRSMTGRAHLQLGVIHAHLGDLDKATTHLEKSVGIFQGLTGESSESSSHVNLAKSHWAMGKHLIEQHRLQDAVAQCSRAVSIASDLASNRPNAVDYQELLSDCQTSLGIALTGLDQFQQAAATFRDAFEIREQIHAKRPNNLNTRVRLAAANHNLAKTLMELGELEEAESMLRKAIQIEQPAVEENPTGHVSRSFLAKHFAQLAEVFSQTGRQKEAVEAYGKSQQHWQALINSYPKVPDFHFHYAKVLIARTKAQQAAGEPVEVLTNLEQAIEHLERLKGKLPRGLELLAEAYTDAAKEEAVSHGDYERSAELLTKAIQVSEELIRQFPDNETHLGNLANNYSNLGTIAGIGLEQPTQAESHYLRAAEVGETLVRKHPGKAKHVLALAKYLTNLANLQVTHSDQDLLASTIEKLESLLGDSENERLKSQLVATLLNVTHLLDDHGHTESADQVIGRCILHQRALVDASAGHPARRAKLMEILSAAGDRCYTMHHFQDAGGHFEQAIAAYEELPSSAQQELATQQLFVHCKNCLGQVQDAIGQHEADR